MNESIVSDSVSECDHVHILSFNSGFAHGFLHIASIVVRDLPTTTCDFISPENGLSAALRSECYFLECYISQFFWLILGLCGCSKHCEHLFLSQNNRIFI